MEGVKGSELLPLQGLHAAGLMLGDQVDAGKEVLLLDIQLLTQSGGRL